MDTFFVVASGKVEVLGGADAGLLDERGSPVQLATLGRGCAPHTPPPKGSMAAISPAQLSHDRCPAVQ